MIVCLFDKVAEEAGIGLGGVACWPVNASSQLGIEKLGMSIGGPYLRGMYAPSPSAEYFRELSRASLARTRAT